MRKVLDNFNWGLTNQLQHLVADDGIVVERALGKFQGVADEIEDLGGKTLLPAWIDSHCHIIPTGQDMAHLDLSDAMTANEVLDLLRDRLRVLGSPWLQAVHYDQNRWGGPHITRDQLDSISQTTPIFVRHANRHACVVNSLGLERAGISNATEDPEGGAFLRDGAGRHNGVAVENAYDQILKAIPAPTTDEIKIAAKLAAENLCRLGIASASDMSTGSLDFASEAEAYDAVAREFGLRLRLYPHWSRVFGPRVQPDSLPLLRSDRQVAAAIVSGIKLFADGAIASASAAIYGQYLTSPASESATSGQLIYKPERLAERVLRASEAGYSVATHAIGDYAFDLVLEAYEATGAAPRHRIEHAMILSDAQIGRLAKSEVSVSMQPEFLLRFGAAYRNQLGTEKASRLNRTKSLLDAGVPLSFSTDRPIVPGDPAASIEAAENRPESFDPSENVSRSQALECWLSKAAALNQDAEFLGALDPGYPLLANVFSQPVLDRPIVLERSIGFGPRSSARG